MCASRAIGVQATACAIWAGCAPASAAPLNSTLLLSRPTGLGALPVPGDGFSSAGPKAISGDGSGIVFASGADDLGVRDTFSHIWIRSSGTTTLVDRVPGGAAPGSGSAFQASISRDGSTVCFLGNATNLVAGVTGFHVIVVTVSSGTITVADRGAGADGALGNDVALGCALDAAGVRVVFAMGAEGLRVVAGTLWAAAGS